MRGIGPDGIEQRLAAGALMDDGGNRLPASRERGGVPMEAIGQPSRFAVEKDGDRGLFNPMVFIINLLKYLDFIIALRR